MKDTGNNRLSASKFSATDFMNSSKVKHKNVEKKAKAKKVNKSKVDSSEKKKITEELRKSVSNMTPVVKRVEGLVDVKCVSVRKERTCLHCGATIKVGKLAITSLQEVNNLMRRVYRCTHCIHRAIKDAYLNTDEILECEFEDDVEAMANYNDYKW